MLAKRQNHIVDILSNELHPLTGKELGKMLGVSDRTIRSDVDAINRYYQCELIMANRRSGYCINQSQLEKKEVKTRELIPQTAQERCVYLIKELLFHKKEINLIELQERVFVSGYSIENDLRKIREMIKEYPELKLVRLRHHISLEGSEEDKRKLYKALLAEETNGNFVNLSAIAGIWKDFDLLKIEEDFEQICKKYNYRISEMNYPFIMMHVGVSIERMLNQNYISESGNEQWIKDKEYRIADELFDKISKVYKVRRVEDEVIRFSGLLRGKDSGDGVISFDQEMRNLMEEIMEMLKTEFDVDLSTDEEFQSGMIAHIELLIRRQRNQVEATDLYLQEIKRKYPLVFEMAVRVAWYIGHYCNEQLNENEISFLALHLGAACERANQKKRYRAVAIIPNSRIMSGACVSKLIARFGNRMEVIRDYGFFEEGRIRQDQPDLILTTVALKHNLDIPTVQISLFLNAEDESKVFQTLNLLDRVRYHKEFVKLMERLMKRDLFHICRSMESREEVLNTLCDELVEKGIGGDDFKKNVFRREELSDTSFVYGFAVPHAIEPSVKESCISILLLKEPVKWGSYSVNMVILLAVRESDSSMLRVFFDWLCNIVTDSQTFQSLICSQSYEEFMNQVIQ